MQQESPPRRKAVPVTRQFSRRITAFGAAFALVALPVSVAIDPAFAQPTPSASAGATETASAEAAGSSDGTDGSAGDSSDGSTDGGTAGPDGTTADNGGTKVDPGPSPDPDPDYDKACKAPEDGEPIPGTDGPCEAAGDLKAHWNSREQTLTVKKPNGEPGSLPKSWVGKTFDNPGRNTVSVPVQSEQGSSGDGSTPSTNNDSDTDDSGRSVAEATAQADAPDAFKFTAEGKIVNAADDKEMKFEGFGVTGPIPGWTFTADGKTITAEGQRYTESPDDGTGASDNKDGASSGTSTSGSDNGTDDEDLTASQDGSAKDGSKKADGSTSNADTSTSADEDGVSGDSSSSSDKAASEDGTTPSDSASSANSDASSSGSKDSADSASGSDADSKDSKSENRNADTNSSGGTDSNGAGSDSGSGNDDEKDSDKDGSGSTLGTSDADGTTPGPSTGNGSPDDERETIPGNAGDEWLPGDDEDSETPDYSDPVPRNPDEPAPKDDTDLITGGDQPSPRANQNPATSFGESIISTIVSSWPIFVLAASGMAAVGFIIYLMGRRGKQE